MDEIIDLVFSHFAVDFHRAVAIDGHERFVIAHADTTCFHDRKLDLAVVTSLFELVIDGTGSCRPTAGSEAYGDAISGQVALCFGRVDIES